MSKIPLTASLEETLNLYNQRVIQKAEKAAEVIGTEEYYFSSQLPFFPFFGTTYIPALADKLKNPSHDGQDDVKFWRACDINVDPIEEWVQGQFDEERAANWRDSVTANSKRSRPYFQIMCDGIIIDAHWNYFKTETAAKNELNEIVHLSGSSYEIVKVTMKTVHRVKKGD